MDILGPSDCLEKWQIWPEVVDSAVLHGPSSVLLHGALDVELWPAIRRLGELRIADIATKVEEVA
jgi:hypothetical protein